LPKIKKTKKRRTSAREKQKNRKRKGKIKRVVRENCCESIERKGRRKSK